MQQTVINYRTDMPAKIEIVNAPSAAQLVIEIVCLFFKCVVSILTAVYYLFKERSQISVQQEIVLVTGAGHGIGKELAKAYASEGATVICWDINKHNNEETVKEIDALGYPRAYAYVCDVSNQMDVEKTAKQVQNEIGRVTILINNAGIGITKTILEMDPSEVERVMKVNTLSNFWTINAFLPTMQLNRRGHIVAICSLAGFFAGKNGTSYCASKYGVRGLMEALRQELRTDQNNKINLTIIYPAGVDTGIFKKVRVRFPGLVPILTPKQAAEIIMKAQRQNQFDVSIPCSTLVVNTLMRLLPLKAYDDVFDFIGAQIDE